MLETGKGIDILTEIGGIRNVDAGLELLKSKMDDENAAKIDRVKNPDIILKIESNPHRSQKKFPMEKRPNF